VRAAAIRHSFSVRSLRTRQLAHKVNFLADDNKPGADCPAKSVASWQPSDSPHGCMDSCVSTLTRSCVHAAPGVSYCRPFHVHDESDRKLIELRIARAYVDLLCAQGGCPAGQAISIARIGQHEIRLFEHSQAERADAPLFWLELIDRGIPGPINSCACHGMADALDLFVELHSEAERLEADRRAAGTRPHD